METRAWRCEVWRPIVGRVRHGGANLGDPPNAFPAVGPHQPFHGALGDRDALPVQVRNTITDPQESRHSSQRAVDERTDLGQRRLAADRGLRGIRFASGGSTPPPMISCPGRRLTCSRATAIEGAG